MKRMTIFIIGLIVALFILANTLPFFVLYYPEVVEGERTLPKYLGNVSEVRIPVDGAADVHGLYWPAPATRTVLFFHGNAQNVYHWSFMRDMVPDDYGLLIIDYPGYGRSEGRPTQNSLFRAAEASFNWLVGAQNIPEQKIVIWGTSLGGAVAINTAKGKNIAGLIVESSFSSIPSMASRALKIIPIGYLMFKERYDSVAGIPFVTAPVLIIHGEQDNLIPIDEGRKLFDAAKTQKEFYPINGAGHNDGPLVGGTEYEAKIRRWLQSLFTTR